MEIDQITSVAFKSWRQEELGKKTLLFKVTINF